jgi:hypothetical protein
LISLRDCPSCEEDEDLSLNPRNKVINTKRFFLGNHYSLCLTAFAAFLIVCSGKREKKKPGMLVSRLRSSSHIFERSLHDEESILTMSQKQLNLPSVVTHRACLSLVKMRKGKSKHFRCWLLEFFMHARSDFSASFVFFFRRFQQTRGNLIEAN